MNYPGDILDWKQRKKDEPNWRARNHADNGTYIAYVMDEYGTPRIYGVIKPDDGPGVINIGSELYVSVVGVGSLAEAKDAAQEHHYAACRAARWAKYMRAHEPPDTPAP